MKERAVPKANVAHITARPYAVNLTDFERNHSEPLPTRVDDSFEKDRTYVCKDCGGPARSKFIRGFGRIWGCANACIPMTDQPQKYLVAASFFPLIKRG